MAGEPAAGKYRPISEAEAAAHAEQAETQAPLAQPTLCPRCGAVFYDGRWRWGLAPERAHEAVCPACQHEQSGIPAAELLLQGDFVASHPDEISALAREAESREKANHPLRRVMEVEHHGERLLIKTTSMHLAREISRALHHAYRGELVYLHDPERHSLRVVWTC